MNVYEKLVNCRVELQNKKLKKSGHNKFANFNYYELGDFIPAVNELFLKYKLYSNFSLDEEVGTLEIRNIEKIDEAIYFTTNIKEAEVRGVSAIQSLGATHTYIKRYLYLNALEIVENDALDKMSGSKQPTKNTVEKVVEKSTKVKITKGQKQVLESLKPEQLEALNEKYNGIDNLTVKQASELIAKLKEAGHIEWNKN